ncbi:hypothetical protein NLJ89_g8395 [Agrocybe chaxingu]|uniref:C2H2-type domain-containing protein n=1 Tax=Agrocybe chaxingu TaxID=84603 RepID=A0A9W8MQU0_9AGAR|nr:hypothetical protein NLJ89_g8395 [Agrocybe chaxingu]
MSATISYSCQFCYRALRTPQGLQSHFSQSAACAAELKQLYEVVSQDHAATGEEQPHEPSDVLMDAHPALTEDYPASPPPPPSQRATVADVDDSEEPNMPPHTTDDLENCWIEDYPEDRKAGLAGLPCQTSFEYLRRKQQEAKVEPWAPFESKSEWELARWLMTSNVSQNKIDMFLKLESIKSGAKPGFHNSRSLLQHIDLLPKGPEWICSPFLITGDELDKVGKQRTETVELWHRNPVDCIKELMSNPAFEEKLCYSPCHVYRSEDGSNREYSEMWTADWWWETQDKLPIGATVAPIILSSDKTNLSTFSGDKQAWPVYLTIGNIEKATRRQPSSRAMVLIGYIPVCKLECFSKKRRSSEGYQLFHECMRRLLEPLVQAGQEGVDMECADGFIRRVYPILSAYIADYPEQCLVACCKENACPQCTVPPDRRGAQVHSVLRDPNTTLEVLAKKSWGQNPSKFVSQSLRAINPFWASLPHCNIFSCITPDLLHQLHKGVFKDHIVSWATEAISGAADEVDRRFRTMSTHPTLRYFKKGISLTTQWTGNEHKNMEKVFLGILAGATDPAVIRAVRAVLDFIYYAHFETHTDESLAQLDAAWVTFHENKKIFEDLSIRKHFNISKLHNIKHYVDSIRSRGTADGFNTEGTERLHIDLAKMGYRRSNKKAYIRQMTKWLSRQEAIQRFCTYLQWAVENYEAKVFHNGIGEDSEGDDNEEEEEEVEEAEINEGDQPDHMCPKYSIAKTPAIPAATVISIVDNLGADDFLVELNTFLERHRISSPLRPSETSRFPIYKQVRLTLSTKREVSGDTTPIRDTILAVQAQPGKVTKAGVKHATPGKFSTVLVRERKRESGKGPLDGLRAAQVRAIFRLPLEYGCFQHPLAYVYWYKPFQNSPVKDLEMYQVSLSTRNHRQRASIVSITEIIQTCHLIPHFGRAVDPYWSTSTVLQDATTMYLNPYLRHYDFYTFCFIHDLYVATQKQRLTHIQPGTLHR